MKFGITLTATGWTGEGTGYTFQRFMQERKEMTRVARESGFTILSIAQHFCASEGIFAQPIPTLAWLAEEAKGMLLHTGVLLLPLYQPVMAAEEMATLDTLSGGRLVIGAGLAYRPQEFQMMGLDIRDRVSRQEEAVQVIKALFTNKPVTFHGKHFHLDHVTMYLSSIQKPHPPIWLGSGAEPGARRAARIADGLYLGGYPHLTAAEKVVKAYRDELKRLGEGNGTVGLRREIFLEKDFNTARGKALPGLMHTIRLYAERGLEPPMLPPDLVKDPEGASLPFLLGSPEEVREQILAYQERLGTSHLVMRFQAGGRTFPEVLRSLETFGSKVIAKFPS